MPDVPDPERRARRSATACRPRRRRSSSATRCRSGSRSWRAEPGIGHPPWEDYEPVTSERATWQRLDDPPLLPDGRLDPVAYLVLCDMMPGAVAREARARCRTERGSARAPTSPCTCSSPPTPSWLLAHNRARWAGDGYASVDMALWDPTDRSLVAYATQMMFFTFPEGW